jgi:hypothetical protein
MEHHLPEIITCPMLLLSQDVVGINGQSLGMGAGCLKNSHIILNVREEASI